jgi:hypothetical protein
LVSGIGISVGRVEEEMEGSKEREGGEEGKEFAGEQIRGWLEGLEWIVAE